MKKITSIFLSIIMLLSFSVSTFAKSDIPLNLVESFVTCSGVDLISKEVLNSGIYYEYKIGDTVETAIVGEIDNGMQYVFEDDNGLKNEVVTTTDGEIYIDNSLVEIRHYEDENFSIEAEVMRLVDEDWYYDESPFSDGPYNKDNKTTYSSLTFDRTVINLTLSAIVLVIAYAIPGVNIATAVAYGSTFFAGAEVIRSWAENNDPDTEQLWMTTERWSNGVVDSDFDSASYYYQIDTEYYGNSSRSDFIGNDYAFAERIVYY